MTSESQVPCCDNCPMAWTSRDSIYKPQDMGFDVGILLHRVQGLVWFEPAVSHIGRGSKCKFKPLPQWRNVNSLRAQTHTWIPSLWIHSLRFESARIHLKL